MFFFADLGHALEPQQQVSTQSQMLLYMMREIIVFVQNVKSHMLPMFNNTDCFCCSSQLSTWGEIVQIQPQCATFNINFWTVPTADHGLMRGISLGGVPGIASSPARVRTWCRRGALRNQVPPFSQVGCISN